MMPKRTLRQITIGKRAIHAKAIGYMKPNIDPNTRLYVPFNEGVGALAKDYSQYGNHAVLTDVEWGIGYNGNAGVFNGASSYGNCGNHASLDITDAITITIGMKLNEDSTQYMMDKRDVVDIYVLTNHFNIDGSFYSYVNDGRAVDAPIGSFNIVDGWFCMVLILKTNSTDNHIYKNGVDISTNQTSRTLQTSIGNLIVGRKYITTHYLNGTIASVIIKALAESAAQIAADCYEVCN